MKNKILPILKPANYKQDKTTFLKERLIDNNESPIIAYGKDVGSAIQYNYSVDETDFNKKLDEIRKEALSNLKKIEIPYSIEGTGKDKFFSLQPHEYSSEKILDKDFLKKVHQELGSNNILVVISHKGIFNAIRMDSSFKMKLPGFAIQLFENPQADIITPMVFNIIDGEINSMIGADNKNSENNEPEFTENQDGSFIISYKSSNENHFIENLKNSYQLGLLQGMQNPSFNGYIKFEEKNKSMKFNKSLISKCHNFTQSINENEMAQTLVKAINKNELVVEIFHNSKLIASSKDKNMNNESKPWWKIW